MPGKVLLFSINQCEDPYPVFPLGLAHVDAALKRAGHKTEWYDLQIDREPLAELIARVQPDYIGISTRNIDDVIIKRKKTFFGKLVTISQELRTLTRAPIILGGSGFSIFPERLLELSGADYGIHGAGEVSFPLLLRMLETKEEYSGIAGLVFRRAGFIEKNPQAPPMCDTPLPWSEFPTRLTEFYLRRSSMLNVQTQRGCSHGCCYCTYPLIEGRRYRRRSADAVAEELQELQKTGAKYVFIVDSVFNSSAAHVADICEAILHRNIRIRWGCFLRPKNLNKGLMRLMARAGLSHIEFGSDSFCDSVLRYYGKSFTFDDVLASSELARGERVDFCHFLICGGPGETVETLRTSFENSLRLKDAVILALVGMRVYPGTKLFRRAVEEEMFPETADFLEPRYYLTPSLTADEIFSHLREFSRISPNWVAGDPSQDYLRMAERLRSKGVVGPLWSYVAMMQRLVGFGKS